jgi:hypothetical protein
MFYKFFGAIIVLSLIGISSCKKSDNNGLGFGGKSEISMNVDGKPWKAKFAVMMTMPPEDDDDYYIITMTGSDVEVDASDEIIGNTQGLHIWFAVPKSKFKAPKGVYRFTNLGADNVSEQYPAFAMFSSVDDEGDAVIYSTVLSDDATSGSLKLDGFKIGKQEFLGHLLSDTDGYTNLTGTFSMNMSLYSETEDTTKVIKITNGKFNVNSGFDLGSLFGQFPEVEEKFKELK